MWHEWDRREMHKVLVHEHEGKRPLGRPRPRWQYISMDLKEIGWKAVDCTDLALDRDKWRDLVDTENKY
jgi:hypothetical protein